MVPLMVSAIVINEPNEISFNDVSILCISSDIETMVPLMVWAMVNNEPNEISFKLISIFSTEVDINVTLSLIIMVSEISAIDILSSCPDKLIMPLIIPSKSTRESIFLVSKKANIRFRNKFNV